MIVLIAVFAGILLFFIFLLTVEYMRRSRKRVSERIRRMANGEEDIRPEEMRMGKKSPGAEFFLKLARKIAPLFSKSKKSSDLNLRMQQANLPLLGSEFLAMLLICALGGFIYVFLLTFEFLTAVLVAIGVAFAGWFYTEIRISRRRSAFTNQLADTLAMTANAMRTGFSFLQAIELISREMEDPMGTEFGKVLQEVNLGTPLEVSLDSMAKRVQSSDFELLVTAILIQRKVGGSLATILDSISATISERIRVRREVVALTSQGRFSGYILGALPFAIGIYMYVVNPEFIAPLLTEELGNIAIGVGILLELIGFFAIQKIVDIKL